MHDSSRTLRAGDPDAFGRLYDKWFDRVHDLAFRILYDQEAAADVAQDAFVAAWRGIDTLDDDHAFGGWLLRIGRNGALNRKRKEQRSRPVDETQLAMIERAQTRPEDLVGTIDDPAQVAANASVAALLWDAADALGERDRDVLDLQLRHGLTPNEVAEVVGLNRNAANQLVHRVRQRLGTAVGARTLWRDGTPSCAALRAELVAAEADEFDADAVRVIDRHANVCAECEGRRKQRLSPAAMFAALPILSLPALKAKVAAALMAQGAPMQGSTAPADAAAHPATTELHPMSRAVNHTGRWRRFALGAVAAAAVILFATWVGASRLDDNSADLVRDSIAGPTVATSGTTSTTTTTTAGALPTSPIGPNPTASPPVLVDPTGPPATDAPATSPPVVTTAPPPPPTITLTITPTVAPPVYLMANAPVLQWAVSGAASITVSGPPSISFTDPSGSAPICPVVSSVPGECVVPPGDYQYTLRARDAAGTITGERNVTLTIG